WMTSLVPLYLKTRYKKDPIFKHTKSVFTIYNTAFDHKFNNKGLIEKVKMMDIEDKMLSQLKTADYEAFIKIGIEYADAVVKADDTYNESLQKLFKQVEKNIKINSFEEETLVD